MDGSSHIALVDPNSTPFAIHSTQNASKNKKKFFQNYEQKKVTEKDGDRCFLLIFYFHFNP